MILKTKLFGHVYEFKSIREVMAKANEEKSGDKLAGIAAETAEERVAAKVVLSNLTLNDLRNCPAVPYEEDEVTRIIQDSVNETIFNEYKNMTVAEFREWLLDTQTTPDMIRRASRGLTSEIVAGVCKLMSNLDLIYAAKKIRVTATCNTTIGEPGTLSARLQPNHPTDDPDGILASLLEGLTYGIGDAVLGLNPVDDSVESVTRVLQRFEDVKMRWEIPTQTCVLAHVTTQMEAIRQANEALGTWRLDDCALYVTLEPCPMCAGAIVQARIPRVVIGSMNAKAGCAGSVLNILKEPGFNHQVKVETGILGEECSCLMTDFFKELRRG